MSTRCFQCGAELQAHYRACPNCGDQISDFVREHLEKPIEGKYEIVSRLGVGGMGEVYKVRHIHLNAIRVLKVMRPTMTGTYGAQERFVREAQLATRIQHPNVATLHDFAALPDGTYYMIWEYIEGTNLAHVIREKGALSPREAALISIDALSGLEAIHEAGIVHRDVSPENIMLTRTVSGEQRVKIIDLGIAKQWDSASGATETGMFVGKWKYCSPEHLGILPEGERIDGRADIYSFGVVMYEMLAGRPPFEAETPHQYVLLHAQTAPKPLPRETIGNSKIEALMLRALEKDRNRRYATAREFAGELRAILPTLSDSALPVGRESIAAVAPTEAYDAPPVASSGAPPTIVTVPQQTELVEPPALTSVSPTSVSSVAATIVDRPGPPAAPATLTMPAFDREAIMTKLRRLLQTPVGKLLAVVVFLGFVALVLPAVTTIIKWALIIAFAIFVIVAAFRIFLWYRSR